MAGPRTARLTRALVYDQQSASSVSARQSSSEDVGDWRITITPRPGHSLTELEAATDTLLNKLKAEGPTQEEMQRATAGQEFDFVSGLQSNLGKSLTLADGAGIHNNPGYFQTEYQKMLAVTPADVKRVANKYLARGRVVLSIVPVGQLDQAAKPSESKPYRRAEQ
jgi:zinc protease